MIWERDNLKEHYNHWLPKLIRVNAVTLGQHVFYTEKKLEVSDRLRRHEKEHTKQYKRDGIAKFLLRYFYEYLKGRLKGMNHDEAYLNISYEIEERES